jgi:hypothetical protein
MAEQMFYPFDSMSAFVAEARKNVKYTEASRGADEWRGGLSFDQACKKALTGDLEAVPAAERMYDQIDAEFVVTPGRVNKMDVAGYFPIIPTFLAGDPLCMRRFEQVESDAMPVKVMFSCCVSGGFSADVLRNRGAAVLALVMKLSEVRPVELWVYADLYGKGGACMPAVRIPTGPLDLSAACHAMANPGFLRQTCFGFAEAHGFQGSWAWTSSPDSPDARRKTEKLLGIGPDDLLIPGGYLMDKLVTKPVEWVRAQLQRFCPQEVQ